LLRQKEVSIGSLIRVVVGAVLDQGAVKVV
jgi:hypothetical protein